MKFFLQLHYGWMCQVVHVLPHTKSANTACKTFLMMDWWGLKHVELTCDELTQSLKTLCILLDCIYITLNLLVSFECNISHEITSTVIVVTVWAGWIAGWQGNLGRQWKTRAELLLYCSTKLVYTYSPRIKHLHLWVSVSQNSAAEVSSLLGCHTVSWEQFLVFQWIMMSSS